MTSIQQRQCRVEATSVGLTHSRPSDYVFYSTASFGPNVSEIPTLTLPTRVLIGGNRESCIIIVELRFRWPPRKRRPVYSSSEAVGLTRLPRIGRPSHNHPITNERRVQNRPQHVSNHPITNEERIPNRTLYYHSQQCTACYIYIYIYSPMRGRMKVLPDSCISGSAGCGRDDIDITPTTWAQAIMYCKIIKVYLAYCFSMK